MYIMIRTLMLKTVASYTDPFPSFSMFLKSWEKGLGIYEAKRRIFDSRPLIKDMSPRVFSHIIVFVQGSHSFSPPVRDVVDARAI